MYLYILNVSLTFASMLYFYKRNVFDSNFQKILYGYRFECGVNYMWCYSTTIRSILNILLFLNSVCKSLYELFIFFLWITTIRVLLHAQLPLKFVIIVELVKYALGVLYQSRSIDPSSVDWKSCNSFWTTKRTYKPT